MNFEKNIFKINNKFSTEIKFIKLNNNNFI
jgi:hypothetical protein